MDLSAWPFVAITALLLVLVFVSSGIPTTYFQNPATGRVEKGSTTLTWLWCLLFGPFYFAYKGVWQHALFWVLFTLITGGLAALIYPFFAGRFVRQWYDHAGWIETTAGQRA